MINIFGKHYGTQRYFGIVALCLAVIILTCGYSGYLGNVANREILGNTVIYTESTVWSRTQNYANVISVASNSDHTKVFMLLQNTAGDDGNIDLQTSNASDYTMYITKREGTLDRAPNVTVYGYGNTGYVGFYFINASGFDSEIWSIILRNDTVASDLMEEGDIWSDVENDVSFRDHNQIRLYMNFGGGDMTTIPSLDADKFDPISAYADCMYAETFSNSQMQLQNCLANMRQNMLTIEQYRSRLESQGVQVPDLPYYIAGDMINTVPNDFTVEPHYFVPEMINTSGSDFDNQFTGINDAGFGQFGDNGGNTTSTDPSAETSTNTSDNLYEDTTTASTDAPGYTDENEVFHPYYYLHTNTIFPAGINVDWQHMTSADCLVTKVPELYYIVHNMQIPSDMSGLGYFDIYNNYINWYGQWINSEAYTAMTKQVTYDSWRKVTSNGIEYVDLTGNTIADQSIANDIATYTTAVNSYINNKTQYFTILDTMIGEEANIRSMEQIMTFNNENTVYAY